MISEYAAVYLSFKCAFFSALVNIPWGMFWGWVLARKNFPGKAVVQTFLYLPLVFPPVLTGYFLLMIFNPGQGLGKFLLDWFHLRFVLDWKGVVVASAVVSSPFMIQSVKQALEGVDDRLEMAARGLGANFWQVLWRVTLPLSWQGMAGGGALVFSRSIGEFGATIMFAGNIPQTTQTIPLAIFTLANQGKESELLPLIVAAIGFSYLGLWLSTCVTKKGKAER